MNNLCEYDEYDYCNICGTYRYEDAEYWEQFSPPVERPMDIDELN